MPAANYLVWAFSIAVALWLGGSLLIVAYSIVSRRISLRGLLTEPATGETSLFSRPQMLFVSLAAIATYVGTAIDSLGTMNAFVDAGTRTLPDVPPELLAAVGGSQLLFVGGKTVSTFMSKLKSLGVLR
jgi:hypothetical protein